jgi:propionyl-CoA synthetase
MPKTRSGKYLRHILRKMAHNEPYTVPPTIEDESVLANIETEIKAHGFDHKIKI